VEGLGTCTLTSKQIEKLCPIVEEAARKYILSKIPSKKIETLDIFVEPEGARPLTLGVDVAVTLSPSMKNFDVQELVDKAVEIAFTSAKKHLGELWCHSQK
jgi:hypothetical protein